uniref:Uncharacterized protein n=1 Tax=Timema douglasi TaxID=61478 RepID=A0A7R8ZBF9_TIMDO|nr:unnamed protein product [Timema douglasi]
MVALLPFGAELVNLRTDLLEARTQYDGIKEELHAVLLKHHGTTPKHVSEVKMGYDVQPDLEFETEQSSPNLPDKGKYGNTVELFSLQNEVTLLRDENTSLRNTIVALQSEVFGAKLTAKYLDKELAGRNPINRGGFSFVFEVNTEWDFPVCIAALYLSLSNSMPPCGICLQHDPALAPVHRAALVQIQQLQLLGREMRGEEKDKLWRQLEAEILLQRHKTLVRTLRNKGSVDSFSVIPEPQTSSLQGIGEPRIVTIQKGRYEELGICITERSGWRVRGQSPGNTESWWEVWVKSRQRESWWEAKELSRQHESWWEVKALSRQRESRREAKELSRQRESRWECPSREPIASAGAVYRGGVITDGSENMGCSVHQESQ